MSAPNSDWLRSLLDQNIRWATETCSKQPTLLSDLSKGQSPKILWIGCSDSRIPETTVLGLQPGDVFVHRNIANIVNPTDLSSLSVIEYAVVYLKVQHIVVCGHTSCGGIAASLGNSKLGKINTWLMPLRSLRHEYLDKLDAAKDDTERGRIMVDANVRRGVETLRQNEDVLTAAKERGLDVIGVVYDLASGQLKPVDEGDLEDDAKRRKAFEVK